MSFSEATEDWNQPPASRNGPTPSFERGVGAVSGGQWNEADHK